MLNKRVLVAIAGIFVLAVAGVTALGQSTDDPERPFPEILKTVSTLELVEIRQSDQVVLSGSFVAASETGPDIEREAILAGTVAGTANGKVEVEVGMTDGIQDFEMEVWVDDLAPTSQYQLFVDGQEIATFTTDADGDARIEFDSTRDS